MPSDGGQKWSVIYVRLAHWAAVMLIRLNLCRELRYIGRWERKKMSEQVGTVALGVPFRSQIAVSVSQNVRTFLNTLGFRYACRNKRLRSVEHDR